MGRAFMLEPEKGLAAGRLTLAADHRAEKQRGHHEPDHLESHHCRLLEGYTFPHWSRMYQLRFKFP